MDRFDPVLYTLEENAFLRSVLGQPPIVALKAKPPAMVEKAVRPVIERVYELIELERADGTQWIGLPAILEKIDAYLEQSKKWEADKRKNAPRFPSMNSYDDRGRPHWSGIGSDSGQVRTYFGPNGQRIPFAIDFIPDGRAEWHPEWSNADKPIKGLVIDEPNRRIECTICGHTESYRPESRGSYNAARARMSKHLRAATTDTDSHREVHTNEFS